MTLRQKITLDRRLAARLSLLLVQRFVPRERRQHVALHRLELRVRDYAAVLLNERLARLQKSLFVLVRAKRACLEPGNERRGGVLGDVEVFRKRLTRAGLERRHVPLPGRLRGGSATRLLDARGERSARLFVQRVTVAAAARVSRRARVGPGPAGSARARSAARRPAPASRAAPAEAAHLRHGVGEADAAAARPLARRRRRELRASLLGERRRLARGGAHAGPGDERVPDARARRKVRAVAPPLGVRANAARLRLRRVFFRVPLREHASRLATTA